MKFVCVDLQGFYFEKRPKMILKELTIVNSEKVSHYVFKPSISIGSLSENEKKTVRYLENHHHHLQYQGGIVEPENIEDIIIKDILQEGVDKIYVLGCIKQQFLKEIFSTIQTWRGDYEQLPLVVNLERTLLSNIPKIDKNVPLCNHHISNKKCVCSKRNALKINDYVCSLLP